MCAWVEENIEVKCQSDADLFFAECELSDDIYSVTVRQGEDPVIGSIARIQSPPAFKLIA